MTNGKRKMKNENRNSNDERFSAFNFSFSVCPACGTESRRGNAKFCFTCGKLLKEDYQPLDTLRSSYRLQGKTFLAENAPPREDITDLFARNENDVSQTAWACCVYSMVPYLGILFIPLTLILGSFGFAVSYRQPHLGGRKLALISVSLSFGILIIQIFLWWLLYIIPELGSGI